MSTVPWYCIFLKTGDILIEIKKVETILQRTILF